MAKFLLKECGNCHKSYSPENYFTTKCIFFKDGYLTVCKDCIEEWIKAQRGSLEFMDKLCRWADYPFLPDQWTRLYSTNKEKTFGLYISIFEQTGYGDLGWAALDKKWREAQSVGTLESQIGILKDEELRQLQFDWGMDHDIEDLQYLQGLYNGFLQTYPVNGADQIDAARKICEISLIVREKIKGGEKYKDDLDGQKRLMEIANFTPATMKNAADFDSVGELFLFLEKRKWLNRFYDGVERDVVDNTMKNIQASARQLYVGETGIADDIQKRIEALKMAQSLEQTYDEHNFKEKERDLDAYDMEGFDPEEAFSEEVN